MMLRFLTLLAVPAMFLCFSVCGCSTSGTTELLSPSADATSASNSALTGTPPRHNGLRVMSFNLRVRTLLDLHNHWNLRRDLLASTILRFRPDILATQECLLPQASFLRGALDGYGFVGVGRDDGAERGEMCGVFFRNDLFEKLDEGHFWLSENPDKAGSRGWDAWFVRMATWIKLRERHGQRQTFYVFNTHLDSNGDRARAESAKLLQSRINRIAGNSPVLLTGDFNAPEGSPPYQTLVDLDSRDTVAPTVVLNDTYRQANPIAADEEGTRHRFRGTGGDDRIDWILASMDFETLDASIDHTNKAGRYPSDHFPVTAVLRWKRPIATAALQQPSTGVR